VFSRRETLSIAVLCAIALLRAAPAQGQWQGWRPVGYLGLIDSYRTGDVKGAVAEILRWPREHVERSATDLVASVLAAPDDDPRAGSAVLEAAILLHTDAAIVAEPGDLRAAEFHMAMAEALVEGVDRVRESRAALRAAPRLVPTRDWLLVAVGWWQGRWQLGPAGELLERLLRAVPDDPQVRLAAGMYEEARHAHESRTMAQYGRLPRGPMSLGLQDARTTLRMRDEAQIRQRLVDAAGHFERALRADPGLHEARVRLARVEILRGNPGEADDLLVLAREGSRDPVVLYLAELFTGRRADVTGAAEAAVAAYQRATLQLPHAQAGRVALAHALERRGRIAEARAALQAAMAEPRATTFSADPWWDYQFGYARHGSVLLDRLRARVVRQ